MLRRIVTSVGRTAFQSRSFKFTRMVVGDKPAGFGAGQNIHSKDQGQQKSWDTNTENLSKQQQERQGDSFRAREYSAENEGMTLNKDQTFGIPDIDKASKNTAGSSPHDTNRPWESQSQAKTKLSSGNMTKSTDQHGSGASQSGNQMADNMRTTGTTNQGQASHVHGQECSYGEKCGPYKADQYGSKNRDTTQTSQQYRQSGSKLQEGSGGTGTGFPTNSQRTDQEELDQANIWMKDKYGSGANKNQHNFQDVQQRNRTTADSGMAFNDQKEEVRQDRH